MHAGTWRHDSSDVTARTGVLAITANLWTVLWIKPHSHSWPGGGSLHGAANDHIKHAHKAGKKPVKLKEDNGRQNFKRGKNKW